MILLLSSLALAAPLGTVRLVEGSPEFTGCLEDDACAEQFHRFLTWSLLSQGFTFQGTPAETAAPLRADAGFPVGARIDTFPFGPPPENLSGKEENTQFSPVLPRLFGGFLSQGARPFGLELSLLPPIPVGGASALVVGLDGSIAWQLGATRLGGSLDLTYARARAPIVASKEQLEDRDSFSNPDNLDPETYEAVCGDSELGCLDTFQQLTAGLHGLASWELGRVRPYARAGLTLVDTSLYVMYDDTTWALLALQPGAGAGVGLTLGDVFLHAGADLAPHGPEQGEEGKAGLFFKAHGSVSYRLGQPR